MAAIHINGKTYKGNNVTIDGKTLIIDGEIHNLDKNVIKVELFGNVENLIVGSADVMVEGDILGNLKTGSGDVECKMIHGSVSTGSGDVEANYIKGDVSTKSGDIEYSAK